MQFFSLFVFGQKRLEIRFNDVLERKEPLFNIKTTVLNVSKIEFFQKGQPMLFCQKMPNFSIFRFGQNKTRINA